jgi:exosome complex component RRP4
MDPAGLPSIVVRAKRPLRQDGVTTSHMVVTPGEVITSEGGFLRGHGTFEDGEGALVASVAGVVERVNKLISVRPVRARFQAEIGDVVLGRVVGVGQKRWALDVGGHQDASLMLSAVTLPGGAQRKRTAEDQLQMRSLYTEGDLISAEVQAFQGGGSGSVALHTRSLKYGKLENGQFVVVPAALIKRLKQHFVTLPCGVDLIIGTNGWLWITRPMDGGAKEAGGRGAAMPDADTLQRQREEHAASPISPELRERICRVRNVLMVLANLFVAIHPPAIMALYERSVELGLPAKALLDPVRAEELAEALRDL